MTIAALTHTDSWEKINIGYIGYIGQFADTISS